MNLHKFNILFITELLIVKKIICHEQAYITVKACLLCITPTSYATNFNIDQN